MTNECGQCEKDIRGCFEAGAKRVSIDFTEGRYRLASRENLPANTGLSFKVV